MRGLTIDVPEAFLTTAKRFGMIPERLAERVLEKFASEDFDELTIRASPTFSEQLWLL